MFKSKSSDPSIEWLARSWIGSTYTLLDRRDLLPAIRRQITEYLEQKLVLYHSDKPPFYPENLFKDRKIIKKIEDNLSSSHSGLLIPVRGGFLIKIRSDEPNTRKRFSIAHEIGHTFFFDLNPEIPTRIFNRTRYWVEEDFANFIAGVILLPESSLRKTLLKEEFSPSLESLAQLAQLYTVSQDVLCRRLVKQLHLWDCLLFKSVIESDGTIKTDSSSVSKGTSYESWTIPKLLVNKNQKAPSSSLPFGKNRINPIQSFLVSAITKATSNSRDEKKKDCSEFHYGGNTYSIQSRIAMKRKLSSCISLIRRKLPSS